MLNEALLKQFTQHSPASRVICTRAWLSLSVESKLQIIESYQSVGNLPYWLSDLTLSDSAEIVRVWGMKTVDIDTNEELKDKNTYIQIYGEKAYKKSLAINKAIQNDNSKLVNEHVGCNNMFSFIDFTNISQDSRLIRIRHMVEFNRHIFIKNFDEIYQKLSQEDLIECLDEIIENLDIYRSFPIDIETLEEGWKLASTVSEEVAFRLAKILPIEADYHKLIKAELMLKLPAMAKFWVLKKNQKIYTKELIRFIKMIVEHRESYEEYIFDLAQSILLDVKPNYSIKGFESEPNPVRNIFLSIIKNIKAYLKRL